PADAPQTETPAPAPVTAAPPEPAPQPAATPVAGVSTTPAASAAAGSEAQSIEVVQNGELKLKLNFQDAPLQAVLEYLSETAGLKVISSEPIPSSRITVISRQAQPVKDAVDLINTVLKEKGYNAILSGKNLKVVTLQNIPKENTRVRTVRDPNQI
ncbi:MAG: hypothetical protein M1376_22110, partial [Planctomycetes bacterium]|nr:hypothetical protein [Planctomycetota bacterium]